MQRSLLVTWSPVDAQKRLHSRWVTAPNTWQTAGETVNLSVRRSQASWASPSSQFLSCSMRRRRSTLPFPLDRATTTSHLCRLSTTSVRMMAEVEMARQIVLVVSRYLS